MYRLINQNAPATIAALDRIADLAEYLKLRAALLSPIDPTRTPEFQRAYRRYWRMNAARLPDSFYSKYFKRLSDCRTSGHVELSAITRAISDADGEKHGLQFSFATKLVHMIDPRVPVYDSFVAGFFFFTPKASDRPFDERLEELLAFHAFLTREYARVIRLGLLAPAIAALRSGARLDTAVPDERIIDWLIWAWVSLLRKGAHWDGAALYD